MRRVDRRFVGRCMVSAGLFAAGWGAGALLGVGGVLIVLGLAAMVYGAALAAPPFDDGRVSPLEYHHDV